MQLALCVCVDACVCVLKNCEQALEQKLITMLKQLLLYMTISIWSVFFYQELQVCTSVGSAITVIYTLHAIGFVCVYACVCACMCMCVHECVCMHVCVHACMHVYVWICVRVLLNWKMHGLSTTSYRHYLFWAELFGTTWMNSLPTEYEEILVVK